MNKQDSKIAIEAKRQRALADYAILDTPSEAQFDEIVAAATDACGMPISQITFLDDDRQWFKANIGLPGSEAPLDQSICLHTAGQEGVFMIPDTTQDPRTLHIGIVKGAPFIRFYAGVPLIDRNGVPLGALCVMDTKPNKLTQSQRVVLRALGRQVVTELELRIALKQWHHNDRLNKAILRSATDYAIIATNLAGKITRWTPGAERILGWTEQQMLDQDAQCIFTPADVAAGIPAQEMKEALLKEHGTDERWHMRQDGTRFWASGEMMMLKDEEGNPEGFLKILRDRTEQRAAQEALNESESRYRSLFEAIEAGFCIVEMKYDAAGKPIDYQYIETNSAFKQQTGLTDAAGKLARTLTPDLEQHWCDIYGEVARTGKPIHYENQAVGLNRWFEVHAFRTGNPEQHRVAILFTDVTERKDYESKLTEAERRKRLATAAGEVGLWEYYPQTKELIWDDKVKAMYGLSPEAPIDTEQAWAAVHPDDAETVQKAVSAALDVHGSGLYYVEFRAIGITDNVERWLLVKGQTTFSEGQAVNCIGTTIDISDRKNAELLQFTLATELQHRIKNTLAMVKAIANQTLKSTRDIDAARETFNERLQALSQAHDILTQSSWSSSPIWPIVEGVMKVHGYGEEERIRLEGPNIVLTAKQGLSMALTLHELATNAGKYGSLSVPEGHVEISWVAKDHDFDFTWREVGGPRVEPPTKRGFGSKLVKRIFGDDFGGEVNLDFQPLGVVCHLKAPLAAMHKMNEEEKLFHRKGNVSARELLIPYEQSIPAGGSDTSQGR